MSTQRRGLHETMTAAERGLVAGAASSVFTWIEYGTGLSTVDCLLARRAARVGHGRGLMLGVEGSAGFAADWLMKQPEVAEACGCEFTLYVRDAEGLGPRSEPDPTLAARGMGYAMAPFALVEPQESRAALIDGRFRVACAMVCFLRGVPAVLVHDFTTREHYAPMLEFFDIDAQVDTMVLLKAKHGGDHERLVARASEAIAGFYCDPR